MQPNRLLTVDWPCERWTWLKCDGDTQPMAPLMNVSGWRWSLVAFRSAEYVARERVCRLSKENRRTQLKSFKVAVDSVYMENQCAPEPAHCDYSDREGRSSPWFDRAILLTTFTTPSDALAECRRLCNTEREFLCKSLSLQVKRSKCFISSDDSISFNGPNPSNALMPDRDFIYSERTSCSNSKCHQFCWMLQETMRLAFVCTLKLSSFSSSFPDSLKLISYQLIFHSRVYSSETHRFKKTIICSLLFSRLPFCILIFHSRVHSSETPRLLTNQSFG